MLLINLEYTGYVKHKTFKKLQTQKLIYRTICIRLQ